MKMQESQLKDSQIEKIFRIFYNDNQKSLNNDQKVMSR